MKQLDPRSKEVTDAWIQLPGGPSAWMYMYTEEDGRHAFKNIQTREYIRS